MDKYEILNHYFGHKNFKYPQDQIIDYVLEGKEVIGILPTGFGKSIIFQVLSLLLPGMSIVISPLIALMEDQVRHLKQKNIPATVLHSNLPSQEVDYIYQQLRLNKYKILYLSPERLENEKFLTHIKHMEISLVTVDEAHTLLWAEGFRYAFGHIVEFIKRCLNRPRLLALTATATSNTIQKIKQYLGMKDPVLIELPMNRSNLIYKVIPVQKKLKYLQTYLQGHKNQKGIIYCLTRLKVENLYHSLQSIGFDVTFYHGGMSVEAKQKNQKKFQTDNSLMVCTNAFGMGIDIPNIRFVIEYELPQSIEDLAQQLGRAARDGKQGEGIVLFSFCDCSILQYFIDQQKDFKTQKEQQHKMDKVIDYCLTKECRHTFISRYFGQYDKPCKAFCDNCQKKGRYFRGFLL